MKQLNKLFILLFVLSSLMTINVQANQENQGTPHLTPPQESLDACKSKAENEQCSFTGKLGVEVKGTCHKGAYGSLNCAPANDSRHQGTTQ